MCLTCFGCAQPVLKKYGCAEPGPVQRSATFAQPELHMLSVSAPQRLPDLEALHDIDTGDTGDTGDTSDTGDIDLGSLVPSLVPPLGLASSCFILLLIIMPHASFELLPNGLLQVQVCLILCRIIIHQVEVGPRLLNHPNLLPPEVLDCALH